MDIPAQSAQEEIKVIDVQTWLNRIKSSEKYMKDKFKPRWDLARKRLRSELEKKKGRGDSPTHEHVAILLSVCDSYEKSVYFKNPNVNLTARNDDESEKVENTEIKINDFLKDTKVKKTIKRIIKDAFLGGFGARYIDYEYRDFEGTEPATDEMGQPLNQDVQGIDPTTGQPVMNQVPIMSRNQVVNTATIQRVRPDLVRFPRGFDFDNYQDSPWIGFDVFVPVEELKQDQNFTGTENIEGSKYDDISEKDSSRLKSGDDTGDILWARLHYVFEKPKQDGMNFKMLVFCEEAKETPLRQMDYDKGVIGYPVKFLYHNPLDDDETYPCGDAWNMESQLNAIDVWWRTLVNHVKRSLPQVLYDKGKIKGPDVQNLKKTEDLQYVGLDTNGQPWDLLIKMLEKPPIHPDTNLLYVSARQIISEVGPKSGLTRGTEDSNIKTATEAKIVSTGEIIDLEGRIDDIREFMVDIVLDLAGLFEHNFQGTTTIKGKTGNGIDVNRVIDKTGFTSKINVDVDVDTMQAPNREIYRRQLMDAFATMKLFEKDMAKKKKALDGEWIAKKISETFGIRNFDKAIIDLDIRDPGQESIDFVFKGVPFTVQNGEVFEDHLKNHVQTLNDMIQMKLFEKMKPGYAEALNQHVMETADAQKMMNQPSEKPIKPPINGQRPPMATEMSMANKT